MFSNGDDSGQFMAIKRVKDGLKATVVNLSELEVVSFRIFEIFCVVENSVFTKLTQYTGNIDINKQYYIAKCIRNKVLYNTIKVVSLLKHIY